MLQGVGVCERLVKPKVPEFLRRAKGKGREVPEFPRSAQGGKAQGAWDKTRGT